jgi:2'-5' RNA ligase
MTDAAPALRLFFALWPDQAARAALLRLQRRLGQPPGARAVAPENLHLTMAFLGMQPAALLAQIEAILDRVALPAMSLDVDCYGCFSRARIAWAGIRRPPPALAALHEALMAALKDSGIGHDKASAFRPHISLLRNATCESAALAEPFSWHAPQLALVQSTTTPAGPIYKVLAQRAPGQESPIPTN